MSNTAIASDRDGSPDRESSRKPARATRWLRRSAKISTPDETSVRAQLTRRHRVPRPIDLAVPIVGVGPRDNGWDSVPVVSCGAEPF